MTEITPTRSRGFSVDWLVKGSLTKIGDIFDRLTGRGWKPSSTLATSELIERMKSMMDAEVRENEDRRKYVPHNIKLKMQWDKFSTDVPGALQKLENEFLIAAVDHINDRHYFTYAPISIEVKPDYFTSGVKLFLSFDKMEGDGSDAELDVTLDNLKSADLVPAAAVVEKPTGDLRLSFVAGGKPVTREFSVSEGTRLSVGRTKENDIAIDDQSISKAHASLLLNKEGSLIVADTGSTNGTFVRGERIPYGKAVTIASRDALMFGLVKIDLSFAVSTPDPAPTVAVKVGDFEFSSRKSESSIQIPQPTMAAVPVARETIAGIARPSETPKAPAAQPQNTSANVAPQPGLSEAKIDVKEEKQDWEI